MGTRKLTCFKSVTYWQNILLHNFLNIQKMQLFYPVQLSPGSWSYTRCNWSWRTTVTIKISFFNQRKKKGKLFPGRVFFYFRTLLDAVAKKLKKKIIKRIIKKKNPSLIVEEDERNGTKQITLHPSSESTSLAVQTIQFPFYRSSSWNYHLHEKIHTKLYTQANALLFWIAILSCKEY